MTSVLNMVLLCLNVGVHHTHDKLFVSFIKAQLLKMYSSIFI